MKPRTPIQTPPKVNSNLDTGKILANLKKGILSTIEELKPINELKTVQYVSALYTDGKVIPNSRTEEIAWDQGIRKTLDAAIESSFAKAKDLGNQNKIDIGIEWLVVAEDKNGQLQGVIGQGTLSFNTIVFTGREVNDFFRNVDNANKDRLKEIMSKKLSFIKSNELKIFY